MICGFIHRGSFQDSVSLMLLSHQLSSLPDVDDVSLMMGTPANKALLETTGFWHPSFATASAGDICVAVRAPGDQAELLPRIQALLHQGLNDLHHAARSGPLLPTARRWESACQALPGANLVLISVAGEYAARLARQALEAGIHVMIFSDNVPPEQERELKILARQRNLLVMGPDCGTALIAGVPLAFANQTLPGSIGIIGASGTGIQELCSQIALAGEGVSHAIGLGGRDLSEHIGGLSALSALQMLATAPETRVIVFVSKPPDSEVMHTMMAAMQSLPLPVVALFSGHAPNHERTGNVWLARSLDQAAALAVMLARCQALAQTQPPQPGKKILGLYTGGTLAGEAAWLLADQLNSPLPAHHPQGVMLDTDGHRIIDLGDDSWTRGRPHPMIDPATRSEQIARLADAPHTGVLLVDIVLGYGACEDPAGLLVSAVLSVRAARGDGAPLVVIATVTGTSHDPQPREQQISRLRQADILVAETLPQAVLLARQITQPQITSESPAPAPLLQGVQVINAGLIRFARDLLAAGCQVVHYPWRPEAGGNPRLAALLEKMK